MPDHPIRCPWRSCLQLRLRAHLVLVLLIGAWMGWTVRAARIQRDAVAAIENAGGVVRYSWQWKNGESIRFGKHKLPGWLVHRLGVDYLDHVVIVSLVGFGNHWSFDPHDLMRRRHIEDSGGILVVTEEAMKHLGALTSLEELDLASVPVDDANLAHLQDLTSLQWLSLADTRAGDATLAHLRRFTRLRYLGLKGTGITDGGIVHLKGLTHLVHLNLGNTRVTDAGLVHLKALVNLRELILHGTEVTDAGAQELQKVLPMVTIWR